MAQALYGQRSTATESTLGQQVIKIEQLVAKYPEIEFPILKRWGGKIFKSEVDNVKYQWKEENLRLTRDLLGVNVPSGSGNTQVTATTKGVFNVDDIISIESEKMVVTGVDTTGIVLTVIRGWAGTTAASHTAGSLYIYREGIAAIEGTGPNAAVTQPNSDLYNYSQIFKDSVSITGTEENSSIYRIADGATNASSQLITKHKELAEIFQTALLLGLASTDGNLRRSMGGLKWFIDTFASANAIDMGGSSAWTTYDSSVMPSANNITTAQKKLDDLIQQLAYNRLAPGKAAIYCNFMALRRMREWGIDKLRSHKADEDRGFTTPNTYMSLLGEIPIVLIPGDALRDYIFVCDESRVGYKSYKNRGWFTQELAITGDSTTWQILGEYTEKVQTPKVHGYLYDLGLTY